MGTTLGNVVSMLQVCIGHTSFRAALFGPCNSLQNDVCQVLCLIGLAIACPPYSFQVGAFTDFEEMLNDVREECHATVEAYLSMQASSCRRPGVLLQMSAGSMEMRLFIPRTCFLWNCDGICEQDI